MAKTRSRSDTTPKFPYTTRPAALRKLLTEIPKRPKPAKITLNILKTWKVVSTNDSTPISVLKKLRMVAANGEPLGAYAEFMNAPPKGPRALGVMIKEHYKDLFESSHEPDKNDGELKTFFNIHAGGGEQAINLQIQTFKALCEHADFSKSPSAGSVSKDVVSSNALPGIASSVEGQRFPPIKIDLHIHLPENKSTREYEAIIQDIGKYIYGRTDTDHA